MWLDYLLYFVLNGNHFYQKWDENGKYNVTNSVMHCLQDTWYDYK